MSHTKCGGQLVASNQTFGGEDSELCKEIAEKIDNRGVIGLKASQFIKSFFRGLIVNANLIASVIFGLIQGFICFSD
jgi:hypothetical protein